MMGKRTPLRRRLERMRCVSAGNPHRKVAEPAHECGLTTETSAQLQPDFDGNASISGLMRSSGSGNTMIEDLPLLDMSAIVCR